MKNPNYSDTSCFRGTLGWFLPLWCTPVKLKKILKIRLFSFHKFRLNFVFSFSSFLVPSGSFGVSKATSVEAVRYRS
jgi:hypothetical protein